MGVGFSRRRVLSASQADSTVRQSAVPADNAPAAPSQPPAGSASSTRVCVCEQCLSGLLLLYFLGLWGLLAAWIVENGSCEETITSFAVAGMLLAGTAAAYALVNPPLKSVLFALILVIFASLIIGIGIRVRTCNWCCEVRSHDSVNPGRELMSLESTFFNQPSTFPFPFSEKCESVSVPQARLR